MPAGVAGSSENPAGSIDVNHHFEISAATARADINVLAERDLVAREGQAVLLDSGTAMLEAARTIRRRKLGRATVVAREAAPFTIIDRIITDGGISALHKEVLEGKGVEVAAAPELAGEPG